MVYLSTIHNTTTHAYRRDLRSVRVCILEFGHRLRHAGRSTSFPGVSPPNCVCDFADGWKISADEGTAAVTKKQFDYVHHAIAEIGGELWTAAVWGSVCPCDDGKTRTIYE